MVGVGDPGVRPPALAKGSVSLGLHKQDELLPGRALDCALEQAAAAEAAGFDGVTFSEHHFGHPSYFPNPLFLSGLVLDRTSRIWAGPLPTVSSFRPAAALAEDLAWLAALHPGRVVAGLAAGNVADEAEALSTGGSLAERFEQQLSVVAKAFGIFDGPLPSARPTEEHLAEDPAIAAVAGSVPLISAAISGSAGRRAARLGLGIAFSSHHPRDRMHQMIGKYLEAGGTGPRIMIVHVWVSGGTAANDDDRAALEQSAHGPGSVRGDGREIVDRLVDHMAEVRADTLNIRIHRPGLSRAAVDEQIVLFGREVLPLLRSQLDIRILAST